MSTKIDNKGFIALASVLMLSAIFLAIALGATSRSIGILNMSMSSLEFFKARYAAEACVEYALLELQRTVEYEGDEVILTDTTTCRVIDIEEESEGWTLHVEGASGSHVYGLEVLLEALSPEVEIAASRRMNF
jgi:hypothetical protein